MRILYVEDNPDVTEIVTELFEQNGCVIYYCNSADEALRILPQVEVDLVFTDIRLGPGDNGIDLATRIAQHYPELLIVLTTGYASAVPVEGLATWTIIRKPFNVTELVPVFETLLAAHKPTAPTLTPPPVPIIAPVLAVLPTDWVSRVSRVYRLLFRLLIRLLRAHLISW